VQQHPQEMPAPAPAGRSRRLMAAGAAALVVMVGGGFAAYRQIARSPAGRAALRGQFGHALTQGAAEAVLGDRPFNILLIGNNARGATNPLDPGQADLSYLVHVEPAQDQILFVPIPRDTMVAYRGWNDPIPKFKSAFLMGGPRLAMREASRLLGMPVQDYVATDFQGFVNAINAIGGVTVRIPGRLYDPLHSHANMKPGEHRLGGRVALAYVRIRQNQAGDGFRTNDFERMGAAFGLLAAVRHKVLRHASLAVALRLYAAWNRDVATNLSKAQLVGLALLAAHARLHALRLGSMADTMGISATALPGVNATGEIDGADYVILTDTQIARTLRRLGAHNPRTGLPGLPPPDRVAVTVSDTPDGQAIAAELRRQGLRVSLSTAVAGATGPTQVLYPAGQLPAAEVVGRALAEGNEQLTEASVPTLEVEAG
jgi:LCP family protein required for cell wall assembly